MAIRIDSYKDKTVAVMGVVPWMTWAAGSQESTRVRPPIAATRAWKDQEVKKRVRASVWRVSRTCS